jgi:hypothetical protein
MPEAEGRLYDLVQLMEERCDDLDEELETGRRIG